jgi:hypothetical protein
MPPDEGAAPPAPAPAPPAGTLDGGAPPPTPAPNNALGAGAPPPPPPSFDYIPEKYRTNGADGKLDIDASSRKLAEAHGHLERRLGSGDIPPKAVTDYAVNLPAEFKESVELEALKADTGFQEFLAESHKAGMSQKQLDVMVGQFIKQSVALQNGVKQLDAATCVADLTTAWKDQPGGFDANIKLAYNAAKHYAGEDFATFMDTYKNDAGIIKVLARIGREMGEGGPPPSGEAIAAGQQQVEAVMRTEAYRNPNHPEHASTVQRVRSFFDQAYGAQPKAAGAFVLSSAR